MGSPGWKSDSVSKVGMGAGRVRGWGGAGMGLFPDFRVQASKSLVFLGDLSWGLLLGSFTAVTGSSGDYSLCFWQLRSWHAWGGVSINEFHPGACTR